MASQPPTTVDVAAVKAALIDARARMAQDFGFNRAAGATLACLFLTDGDASLDALESELGLSKAAVSLAAAQLERLGLIERVRKAGDRRRYYRSAGDIGSALRHGILRFARSRAAALEADLQRADQLLADRKREPAGRFLGSRIARLRDLNRRAASLLENPLVRLFAKLG